MNKEKIGAILSKWHTWSQISTRNSCKGTTFLMDLFRRMAYLKTYQNSEEGDYLSSDQKKHHKYFEDCNIWFRVMLPNQVYIISFFNGRWPILSFFLLALFSKNRELKSEG